MAAPEGTRIIAKSISGDISVRDIAGALTLETVSGNVSIGSAGRMASGRSISGNIELVDTKVEGALEAGTISGTVRLRRVSARSLAINSVSGNVELDDVASERIDAQVISGNINFSGDLEPNGRYELTSHSGNVRLASRRERRLSGGGHVIQRNDHQRHPDHDAGRSERTPEPCPARHRGGRRRGPRSHDLLGLDRHHEAVTFRPPASANATLGPPKRRRDGRWKITSA